MEDLRLKSKKRSRRDKKGEVLYMEGAFDYHNI